MYILLRKLISLSKGSAQTFNIIATNAVISLFLTLNIYFNNFLINESWLLS